MHATSCAAHGVDRCVDHRDRRQGRHRDVDQHLVYLHLVRHLDVGHRNLGEHHLGHQDVDRQDLLDVRQDHRDVGHQDLDGFLDLDDYLGLGGRLDLDGTQMDQQDAIQEQCAGLEVAESDDLTLTLGQAEEELDVHQDVRQAAYQEACLVEFHQVDPVVVPDVEWAAD